MSTSNGMESHEERKIQKDSTMYQWSYVLIYDSSLISFKNH